MPPTLCNPARRALALALVALAAGCQTAPRRRHSDGPQHFVLGSGISAPRLELGSFEDARPDVQRTRQFLSDGEAYGDNDFVIAPPAAFLQELASAVDGLPEPEKIRARLSNASVRLRNTNFSMHVAAGPEPDRGLGPGVNAVGQLVTLVVGGTSYLRCRVEVDIDGTTYLGTTGDQRNGDPPPLSHAYVPYFTAAVRTIARQYASHG